MDEHRDGSASDLARFGFDLADDEWLARVNASCAPAAPLAGRVGGYELLATAGRGGQGVVYRARQPHTGRIVALKRLNAGVFATEEMRARFLREIEAASTLEHPHIVAVHGCEILNSGPVAVLQWIDGVALDQWAAPRREAGELRSIVALIAKVARAVNHAHQRGVLHRDLKPSNILVDAAGEPHVLDFGLAKFHGPTRPDEALTETGVFVGTLQYAAPEMALGRRQDVDVRADVYALGAVLHQALTGAQAFEAPTNLAEVVEDFARRDPRPPSSVNAVVDRELDAIVLMALASEKERRYASMSDLADDLERYLGGEAVHAHAPTTRYRIAKLVRRHRVAVIVASAFVAVLIGASVTSTSMYFAAERERGRAERALEDEQTRRRELGRANIQTQRERVHQGAAAELLKQLLEQSTAGQLASGSSVTLRSALDAVARSLPAKAGDLEDEGEAWMHMKLGEVYLELREARAALPHFERALELRRALFDAEHLDLLESLDRVGRARRLLGDLSGAQEVLSESLRIRRKRFRTGDGYLTSAVNTMGILMRHLGRLEESEALLVEALQAYIDVQGPTNESVPIVRRNLALVYKDMGRIDDAIGLSERAVEESVAVYGDDHREVATARTELASIYLAAQRDGEALAQLEQAMTSIHGLHGDRHPTYLQAGELRALARSAHAPRECAQELLDLAQIHRERGDPRAVLRCLDVLAELGQRRNLHDVAEQALRDAVCEAESRYHASDVVLADQRLRLAEHLVSNGRRVEAGPLRAAAEPVLFASPSPHQRARLEALHQALLSR